MSITWFIAKRYLISKKKRNFINFISVLSVIGVGVGTMALIVVLSVFNGLEDLIRNIYGSFDPHLKITAVTGKSFIIDTTTYEAIKKTEGIRLITETIEDNALVKYNDKQAIVKMKGVSDNFNGQYNLSRFLTEGTLQLDDKGVGCAILGRGVQYRLGVDMENRFYQLQFWYPKNQKKLQLNPESAFKSANLFPSGVFALEKQYDDYYVFVPLKFAINLMDYGRKRTSLEINLKDAKQAEMIKKRLQQLLGDKFNIQTVEEQHISMLRAIKIEKLFVYITFTFIMAISSLNIFFTLTMLAIEKRTDMNILFNLGATPGLIKSIFLAEGLIIGLLGALSGLAAGFFICYMQKTYGLISMGTETSLVNAYPIKIQLSDFLITGLIILAVTIIISYQPAAKAAKIEGRIS